VRQVIGAPQTPGSMIVLERRRPVLALGAAAICPRTGDATPCDARRTGHVRTLRAAAGAVLTLIAPSAADDIGLVFRAGRHSVRRRPASRGLGPRPLRVRVPAAGAATVVLRASFSTGRAVYRLRLFAAQAARPVR
jgi:hypothetical protein